MIREPDGLRGRFSTAEGERGEEQHHPKGPPVTPRRAGARDPLHVRDPPHCGSQVPVQNCCTVPFVRRKASICWPAVNTPVDPWAPLLKSGGALVRGGIPAWQAVRSAGSPGPRFAYT